MDPPRVTVAAARMMMMTRVTSPMCRSSPARKRLDRRGLVLGGLLGPVVFAKARRQSLSMVAVAVAVAVAGAAAARFLLFHARF